MTANSLSSNTASADLTIDAVIINCPAGLVAVDGNQTLGTTDFCVMEFEAKCTGACDNLNDIPVSQPAGNPWVSIRADDSAGAGSGAQGRCEAMTEVGFDGNFSLISNPEWITIARDIENTSINWSSGIIGSGHIPRGHTDNNPANVLDVTDINDPYIGTNNSSGDTPGSGWEQKRTHNLSNGSKVWDLAGNVWEWVDWDASSAGFTIGPIDGDLGGWNELNDLVGSLTPNDVSPLGPYTSTQSFGRLFPFTSGGAAHRSGSWSYASASGIFALYLDDAPSASYSVIGFRCTYRPQQAPKAKAITSANANENTESIITLDYNDLNNDQATTCEVSDLTNLTETTPCSCSAGICTIGVTGINNYSGPASFNYTVTDNDGTSNIASASFSISQNILCPAGFVEVNGNGILGTTDFCVMKYEAKCSAGCDNATDIPISQAIGTPWVSIRANASAGINSGAQARCEAMTETDFTGTFSLISNPEWMTIARDIENTASNWSSGIIGSGHIPRGHSDNSSGALAIVDIYDPYVGTSNNSGQAAGSGWEQKRTHILSNGSEIWDLSGNVWEWIDWDSTISGLTSGPTDELTGWKEFSVAQTGASLLDDDFLPIGGYTSVNSFGRWYAGGAGGPARGGGWSDGISAGVFTLDLSDSPSSTFSIVGFRCSYRPD